MSENNLFHFAQVITESPLHSTSHSHSEKTADYRYTQIRKNACIVCSKCFTCSKFYGIDCHCPDIQPRRGKNLPQGGLDSRAKKLHKDDPDYEFSLRWLKENAHEMYKDLEFNSLSEVSLCKAHSSTLYRAKKRHEQPDLIRMTSSQSARRKRVHKPILRGTQSTDTASLRNFDLTVVETVSLRTHGDYYFRNLAITDTFTFRDLLNEIDMTGGPPAGKRIVISDQHKLYPLDQPIRSVIKRPPSSHVELFLSITDKPSINWNHYK
ncbi:unnamed protein product [Rhizopus stolonifer]